MSLTMMKTISVPHHCITVIAVWRCSWKSEPGSYSGIDFNTTLIDSPSSFPLDGFSIAIIQDISSVYHRKPSVFDEFLEPRGIASTSEYTSGAEPTQKALWSDENFQKKKRKWQIKPLVWDLRFLIPDVFKCTEFHLLQIFNCGLIWLQTVCFIFFCKTNTSVHRHCDAFS